ncbi:general secretion pathway protein GspK [Ectothiorhodospira lacustris]|uniref:general secretion pathway protein GspK n=1 Tax=Ectothiorhodospira lacustris TaxID=2899127 RepID=UPI001EE8A793|nr:type II secretion system protein GspK [Ectothiorhodospira lacustris]MCG5500813.1 general secretion pathway protein GspK [Ectothiorhodospira lacustris]
MGDGTGGRQSGYVLVSVLVALVLLTLVAAALDARVERLRDTQRQWQTWAEQEARLVSAREEVLFALSTRPLSQWGFGAGPEALRVDGRPYRLPSGVLVSLQDSRGLVSIATPEPHVMRRLLTGLGIRDREVEPLLDKLADYSDTDDLRRLHGAEAEDYLAAGMAPPRNDWPISPYELRLVLGWADHPEVWSRAGDLFTASREPWINPNTAPATVLAALPGANPEAVAMILQWREQQLFSSATQLHAMTGVLVADEPIAFYPGRLYRLRLWLDEGSMAMEYHLMLTPAAPRWPWQILEVRRVDRPELGTDPAGVAEFPLALVPDLVP